MTQEKSDRLKLYANIVPWGLVVAFGLVRACMTAAYVIKF